LNSTLLDPLNVDLAARAINCFKGDNYYETLPVVYNLSFRRLGTNYETQSTFDA